ncbi:MAG: hypothetical protein R3A45_01655 [Bdellovibrionota bacterium]
MKKTYFDQITPHLYKHVFAITICAFLSSTAAAMNATLYKKEKGYGRHMQCKPETNQNIFPLTCTDTHGAYRFELQNNPTYTASHVEPLTLKCKISFKKDTPFTDTLHIMDQLIANDAFALVQQSQTMEIYASSQNPELQILCSFYTSSDKVLPTLRQDFVIQTSLSTQDPHWEAQPNDPQDIWGKTFFTSPRNHRPNYYRYLVHVIPVDPTVLQRTEDENQGQTIFDPTQFLFFNPLAINQVGFISSSIITENHPYTFGPGIGFILEVTQKGVIDTSSGDIGGSPGFERRHTTSIDTYIRENSPHMYTPEEILDYINAEPEEDPLLRYNEVLLYSSPSSPTVKIVGFLTSVAKDNPNISLLLPKKLQYFQNLAQKLDVPIVTIKQHVPRDDAAPSIRISKGGDPSSTCAIKIKSTSGYAYTILELTYTEPYHIYISEVGKRAMSETQHKQDALNMLTAYKDHITTDQTCANFLETFDHNRLDFEHASFRW